MYYLKIFLTVLYIFLTSVLGILFCIFRPADARNLCIVGKIMSKGVLYIWGINVILHNKHIFKECKNVIYVSNHQHNLDAFVIGSIVPFKTVSLAKRELLYIPIFGLFYYLSGNILIKRQNKNKALKTMHKAGLEIVRKKVSVWIMPEGTRNHGEMKDFKKGAFNLATQIKRPVVPITISNYEKLDFRARKAGTVHMYIHEPISTEKLTRDDVVKLSDHCRELIKNKFENL